MDYGAEGEQELVRGAPSSSPSSPSSSPSGLSTPPGLPRDGVRMVAKLWRSSHRGLSCSCRWTYGRVLGIFLLLFFVAGFFPAMITTPLIDVTPIPPQQNTDWRIATQV
jgi:hypothetical protein